MKTPKMPSPIKSEKPTAPVHSEAGTTELLEKQKRKQGLFSTLLGSGGGTANRLGNYLGISGNSTSNTSLPNNFFNRTKPGGATVAP